MSTLYNAVKARQLAIKRLRANPPASWTPEYLAKNISILVADIARFSSFVGPLQED